MNARALWGWLCRVAARVLWGSAACTSICVARSRVSPWRRRLSNVARALLSPGFANTRPGTALSLDVPYAAAR